MLEIFVVDGPYTNYRSPWADQGDDYKLPYNWLHDIPGCRVIGGMEVQAKDFCSNASLGSIARLLLNKILLLLRKSPRLQVAGEEKSDRGRSVETDANGRPLVVVSHGLAGIVVKQAMLIAWEELQYYLPIVQRACRFVFFGCPHSEYVSCWDQIIRRILLAYSKLPPQPQLYQPYTWKPLDDIHTFDVDVLVTVSLSFISIAGAYDILSYYEDMSGEFTATLYPYCPVLGLDREFTYPLKNPYVALGNIDRTNTDLVFEKVCKHITRQPQVSFEKRMDSNYTRFLQVLIRLTPNYGFLEMNVFYQREVLARHPSCIYHNTALSAWEENDGSSILHIYGQQGSGKSMLLKYLSQQEFVPYGISDWFKEVIQVRFRFDKHFAGYSSIRGFLLAFIRELLLRQPHMLPDQPVISEKEKRVEWTTSVLWDIFLALVLHPARSVVTCFIDDFDECDSSWELFLSRITAEIDGWHSNQPVNARRLNRLKFVVTSKNRCQGRQSWKMLPESHICLSLNDRGVNLHEMNKVNLVQEELTQLLRQRASLATARSVLVKKLNLPDVTTLQAILNLHLLRQYGIGGTPREIKQNLKRIPISVQYCCDIVLARCRELPGVWGPIRQSLSWIVYAKRALTLKELAVAIAINPDREPPFDLSLRRIDLEENILAKIRPLIKVSHETVYLLNPSIRPHIVDRLGPRDNQHALEVFSNDIATRACLSYLRLKLSELRDPLSELGMDNNGLGSVVGQEGGHSRQKCEFDFLRYAAINWVAHFRDTEGSTLVHHEVIRFLLHEEIIFKKWLQLYSAIQVSFAIDYPQTPSSTFLLLCELGLVHALDEVYDTIVSEESNLSQGLHLACSQDHLAVVQWILNKGVPQEVILKELSLSANRSIAGAVFHLLLEYAKVHCSELIDDISFSILLNSACSQGNEDVVDCLLGGKWMRSHLKQFTRKGLTYLESSKPLRSAAAIGHQGIFLKLLDNKHARFDRFINAPSKENQMCNEPTPIHIAAQNGHTTLVEVLKMRGADVACRDHNLRTPLHLACMSGYKECVVYLMPLLVSMLRPDEHEGTLIATAADLKDKDQCLAIHHAAGHGGEGVTRLILSTYISRGSRSYIRHADLHQMMPCHYAAKNNQSGALRAFINKNMTDCFELPGGLENMTPLHFAVAGGFYCCAEPFLDRGFMEKSHDIQNGMGDLPVHIASRLAASIFFDPNTYRDTRKFPGIIMTSMIKSYKWERFSVKNKDGWTPLHILHGSPEILAVILKYHPPDESSYDEITPSGETVLILAAKNGHSDVVAMLLENKAVNVAITDNKGYNALHWAAINGHTSIVGQLLPYLSIDSLIHKANEEIGSDIRYGTPFHLAYSRRHFEAMILIVEKIVSLLPMVSPLPLVNAMAFNDNDLWKALIGYHLLSCKLGVNFKATTGHTALFYAVSWGEMEMVIHLLRTGSDPRMKDQSGRVAADVAKSKAMHALLSAQAKSVIVDLTSPADLQAIFADTNDPIACADIKKIGYTATSNTLNSLTCCVVFESTTHPARNGFGYNKYHNECYYYHCCQCQGQNTPSMHGINICADCFERHGYRCRHLQRRSGERDQCTYKIRFVCDGFISFSELVDWIKTEETPVIGDSHLVEYFESRLRMLADENSRVSKSPDPPAAPSTTTPQIEPRESPQSIDVEDQPGSATKRQKHIHAGTTPSPSPSPTPMSTTTIKLRRSKRKQNTRPSSNSN